MQTRASAVPFEPRHRLQVPLRPDCAPSEGSKPEASGVCHTLWDVVSACQTDEPPVTLERGLCLPRQSREDRPGGSVGTRRHSEVEGAGGGGET